MATAVSRMDNEYTPAPVNIHVPPPTYNPTPIPPRYTIHPTPPMLAPRPQHRGKTLRHTDTNIPLPSSHPSPHHTSSHKRPRSNEAASEQEAKKKKKDHKNEEALQIERQYFEALFNGAKYIDRIISQNKNYIIIELLTNINNNFKILNYNYMITFYEEENSDNPFKIINYLSNIFREINIRLENIIVKLGLDSVCQVTLSSSSYVCIESDFNRFKRSILEELVNNLIQSTQSNAFLKFDDLKISIKFILNIQGHNFQINESYKSAFVTWVLKTYPNSKSCGFISLAHGLYKFRRKNAEIIGYRPHEVFGLAKEIATSTGFPFEMPMSPDDLVLSGTLYGLRLVILTKKDNEIVILKKSSTLLTHLPLILLFMEGVSYYPIESLRMLLKKKNNQGFCYACTSLHSDLTLHLSDCVLVCENCKSTICKNSNTQNDDTPIICTTGCGRKFRNNECYNLHKTTGICKKIRLCNTCNRVIIKIKDSTHDCQKIKCGICYVTYKGGEEHQCMIAKVSNKQAPKTFKNIYIYYDIETHSLPLTHEVEPFVICVNTVCNSCSAFEDIENDCEICGKRIIRFVFEENETKPVVQQFIDYLLNLSKKYPKYKLYPTAHNGSKFDGLFILKYVLVNGMQLLNKAPLKRGNKLLTLNIAENIEFKDSILYLNGISLKRFPETFNLKLSSDDSTLLKKGYYPYDFVTKETLGYDSTSPPPDKYFNFDKMDVNEKEEFLKWKTSKKKYNLMTETITYCDLDVLILRKGVEVFRKTFLNDFDTCIFRQAHTAASLTFHIYRKIFMPENTIPIIDSKPPSKHSLVSLEYIAWKQHQLHDSNLVIQTARTNLSEIKVIINGQHFKVDGFLPPHEITDKDGNIIKKRGTCYEFNGCFFKAHRCFLSPNPIDFRGVPSYTRKERQEKKEKLISTLYNVERVWECEWQREKECNVELQRFLQHRCRTFKEQALNVRDGLCGGRTEAFVLKWTQTDMNERVHYIDFVSLYPYIQFTYDMPCGRSRRLIGEQIPPIDELITKIDKEYIGMISCTVLPPKGLLYPVLPYKTKQKNKESKLLFILCRTCGENQINECVHDINERSLSSVWTTPELAYALDQGYTLLEVYEVLAFEKKEPIFKEFTRTFFKLKAMSEGCENPDDLDDLLKYFEERGIPLEREKINKNAARRMIMKLLNNCLWGKFCENPNNYTHHELVKTPQELWHFLNSDEFIVKDITCSADRALIKYAKTAEAAPCKRAVNVVIGSFVTCYARLHLLKLMNKLKGRIYYVDTDSCIYMSRGDYEPPLTKYGFLGELSDELRSYGKGSFCSAFVCLGPKTYSLKIQTPLGDGQGFKTSFLIKCKGFSVNPNTQNIITFDNYLRLLDEEIDRIAVPTKNFRAFPQGGVGISDSVKYLSKTFNKRVIIRKDNGVIDTIPFGF
ncbi:unnamed protein product [Rotaria socialis]|uniref:DNA-directed DNA polymerase n=1 Tax=Rotaria socialis TaxID=392032 RepID=A0A818UZ06_9BILA|nr:unnamed protein product [Rotaria socialis]